jgi:hypothetical protein
VPVAEGNAILIMAVDVHFEGALSSRLAAIGIDWPSLRAALDYRHGTVEDGHDIILWKTLEVCSGRRQFALTACVKAELS